MQLDVSRSDDKRLETYKEMLRPIVKSGILHSSARELLHNYRKQHNISNKMHAQALSELEVSRAAWQAIVAMGEDESPDEIYGPPKCPQVYYHPGDHSGKSILKGVIAIPHLRQWYETKDGKKENFWREKTERKASWLELFFDLVFVSVIYSLSNVMIDHFSPILEFFVLYTTFFRIWVGITTYSTRYEHEDWLHPVVYCTTMIGLNWMVIYLPDVYYVIASHSTAPTSKQKQSGQYFNILFLFTSFPTFFMYCFTAWAELTGRGKLKESKRDITYHPFICALVLLISFIPWIIAACLPNINPLPMWLTSLIFSEVAFIFVGARNYVSAPVCVEHWGERLALFLMIHLGESMFAVATDFSKINFTYQPFVASAFGLIIPFSFRRIYFEVEGTEPKEPHVLRRNRWVAQIFLTFQWLLHMSIIGYAVGFKGLMKVTIHVLEGHPLAGSEFYQLHQDASLHLPPERFELDFDELLNCTTYMHTHNVSLASSHHKRAFMADPPADKSGESSSSVTDSLTTACLALFNTEKYTFWERQSEVLFLISLLIIIACVAILSALSVTSHEALEGYLIPHSDKWRLATRIALVILFLVVGLLNYAHVIYISAFNTIIVGGCIYFFWAVIESFFVLRKKYVGSLALRSSQDDSSGEEYELSPEGTTARFFTHSMSVSQNE